MNQELLNAASKCKSVEEILAMAKENNVEVSAEEAKKFLEQNSEGALMDEELDNVAGGCGTSTPTPVYTYHGPQCPTCGKHDNYYAYTGENGYHCNNCNADFTNIV